MWSLLHNHCVSYCRAKARLIFLSVIAGINVFGLVGKTPDLFSLRGGGKYIGMVSETTGWASLRGAGATRQSILLLLGFTKPTVLHLQFCTFLFRWDADAFPTLHLYFLPCGASSTLLFLFSQ